MLSSHSNLLLSSSLSFFFLLSCLFMRKLWRSKESQKKMCGRRINSDDASEYPKNDQIKDH